MLAADSKLVVTDLPRLRRGLRLGVLRVGVDPNGHRPSSIAQGINESVLKSGNTRIRYDRSVKGGRNMPMLKRFSIRLATFFFNVEFASNRSHNLLNG